jgi:hypothetical protein
MSNPLYRLKSYFFENTAYMGFPFFHIPGPTSLIKYAFIGKWKAFKCELMHVEYMNDSYTYYMCMVIAAHNVFCPYQAI